MDILFMLLFFISFVCTFIFLIKGFISLIRKNPVKKHFKYSGISVLVMIVSFFGVGLTAEVIAAESITISIPDYQEEYDINTNIPVEVSVLPEDATTSSLKYIASSEILAFSKSGIITGTEEGICEIYIESNGVKSNSISITVVDMEARKAAQEAEEKRLAEENIIQETNPEFLPISEDITYSEDESESIITPPSLEDETKKSYEYDTLQQLYIDLDSNFSYTEVLEFIKDSGLAYTEEKYNGSRQIQVAFSSEATAQKYNKSSESYVTITYVYPKNENSANDELEKYLFGTCCYCPSDSSLTLIQHQNGYYFSYSKPGNYISDLGSALDLDASMSKEEQMQYYYDNK